MCLPESIATSSALIDFGRPTNSGITMCGNTTTSRNGSSGSECHVGGSEISGHAASGRECRRKWGGERSLSSRAATRRKSSDYAGLAPEAAAAAAAAAGRWVRALRRRGAAQLCADATFGVSANISSGLPSL
jgi:hypothetical protein